MKNAIEEEKVVMTADEAAFIDRFVAEHCRPHAAVMAERLRKFVVERQMAMFAVEDEPAFALAAGPAAKVPEASGEFAINTARERFWDASTIGYVKDNSRSNGNSRIVLTKGRKKIEN